MEALSDDDDDNDNDSNNDAGDDAANELNELNSHTSMRRVGTRT